MFIDYAPLPVPFIEHAVPRRIARIGGQYGGREGIECLYQPATTQLLRNYFARGPATEIGRRIGRKIDRIGRIDHNWVFAIATSMA